MNQMNRIIEDDELIAISGGKMCKPHRLEIIYLDRDKVERVMYSEVITCTAELYLEIKRLEDYFDKNLFKFISYREIFV